MLNFRFFGEQRLADLEAGLTGVAGHTGRGEIEYSAWRDGSRQIEIEFTGVAGKMAELYINGERIKAFAFDNGKLDAIIDTQHGNFLPAINDGDQVEIRQNGQPILSGTMRRD